MKKLFYLLLVLIAAGCSYGDLEEQNKQQLAGKVDSLSKLITARKDDSLIVYIDSLMKADVKLPPVFNPMKYDSTTASTFAELASRTDGAVTLLASSSLIKDEICRILDHYATDDGDIVFLIDKTGSMADDIDNIKKGLKQIIGGLKKYNNLRLAIALYGDKNVDGPQWFSYQEFGTDYNKASDFLRGIQVTGGADYPESVYDGYFEVQQQSFWRSSKKRMIVLIGDAPSLVKPLSDHSLRDVIASATENDIKMNFYPVIVSPVEGYYPEEILKGYEKKELVSLVYPNPSQGKARVNFTGEPVVKIEVYSSSAKLLLSQEVSFNGIDLDLSDHDNGLYILRAYDKDHNYDEARIVIAR